MNQLLEDDHQHHFRVRIIRTLEAQAASESSM